MAVNDFFQDPAGALADAAEAVYGALSNSETTGFMSSFTKHLKYPLTLEQIPAYTQGREPLRFSFEDDDLPDSLPLGGKLARAVKKYPNNVIADHQVIRTEENTIRLKGEFWSRDSRGRLPIDKAEYLEAMRLEGVPCILTYMNRVRRLCFIDEFTFDIHDPTEIEWELVLEVYQHGDQEGLSSPLGEPMTSRHARIKDITGRLNSSGEALAEIQSRMTEAGLPRGLKSEMAPALGPIGEAMTAIGQATNVYKSSGEMPEEMALNRLKDFSNKLHRARIATERTLRVIRAIPMDPLLAAEKAAGFAGVFKRRSTLREASITVGRVREDLRLMIKDTKFFNTKSPRVHIVSKDDTLRSIAIKYYGDANRWTDIAEANRIQDPTRIRGTRLIIP